VRRPLARQIEVSDAARPHAVAHQPVAEDRPCGAQDMLAQDAAMGVHQRESGIVADRADVAEMVGEPFELGHQARSQWARGGASTPHAASTARAKATA
jgi:hypothetical protein